VSAIIKALVGKSPSAEDEPLSEIMALGRKALQQKRAKELAPKNPREPWVEAVIWYNIPQERGGSQEKAIAMYRDAIALARAERVSDPLWPDWGEPEALMSLSYCFLHRGTPDVAGAKESAEAALRLRPDWYYLREVLRPQIEEALHVKPAKN